MIAVAANDGVLRVHVEVKIPSAEGGQWSPERHAKLAELIRDYVDAAELVDDTARGPRRYLDGTLKPKTR